MAHQHWGDTTRDYEGEAKRYSEDEIACRAMSTKRLISEFYNKKQAKALHSGGPWYCRIMERTSKEFGIVRSACYERFSRMVGAVPDWKESNDEDVKAIVSWAFDNLDRSIIDEICKENTSEYIKQREIRKAQYNSLKREFG